MKEFLLNYFWPFLTSRLPHYKRGYEHYWMGEAGKDYRLSAFNRQQDLATNPTFEEMREAIDYYNPDTVLEIGCGWGRVLDALSPYFNIEGYDVSDDLLALVPPHLAASKFDLVRDVPQRTWDVVIATRVFMYFADHPEDMKKAVAAADAFAVNKVIVWEWPHVIEEMKPYATNKFEFRPIAYRKE